MITRSKKNDIKEIDLKGMNNLFGN